MSAPNVDARGTDSIITRVYRQPELARGSEMGAQQIKEGPASAALRLVVLRRTTNAGSSLPQFRAILRR
jgi:hypothetical protein